ncbi:MAG: hypothetical protein ACI4AH_08580 [Muribaculaceae bacterium]
MEKIKSKASIVCKVLLGFVAIWAAVMLLRVLAICGLLGFEVGLGIDIAPVVWFNDPEVDFIQWIEIIGYVVTNLLMIWLMAQVLITAIKGLKSGNVFSRKNVCRLYALATVSLFYEFFDDNRCIIYGAREMVLNTGVFTTPLIICCVALIYAIAVSTAEENSLTI